MLREGRQTQCSGLKNFSLCQSLTGAEWTPQDWYCDIKGLIWTHTVTSHDSYECERGLYVVITIESYKNLGWKEVLEIIRSSQGLTLFLAQRLTLLSSEYLQGWWLHIFSGQLAPVFDHPYSDFFPCISSQNFATYACCLLSFLCAPLRRFSIFFLSLIISDVKSTVKTLPLGHK